MISVIIPAYNAQAYLRECLESVLAQSFSDWEAIIVDDGSTDATLSIAREYATLDRRFRVVHTANKGVSSARNVAMDMSEGQWITFLDSDDLLPRRALECYMRCKDTCADIISGGWSRDVGHREPSRRPIRLSGARKALAGGLYQTGISTIIGGKLYRREYLLDNIRFEAGMRYEDLLFFCQVCMQARTVAEIDDTVYVYRDNPSSFINRFTPDRLDVLRVTGMIESMCADDPLLLPAARDRRLSAAFNIFGLLSVHDRAGEYTQTKDWCWSLIRLYRHSSLCNRGVRLKNRLGILASYLGRGGLSLLSRIVYS